MTAYDDGRVSVHLGDCLDVLRTLPDASVDAVVTDPPYGLEFMGKDWDAPWKPSSVGRGVRVESERADEMTTAGKGHTTSAGPYLAARVDSTRVAGKPFQQWCELWATECLRVLKPGGHLLAFGGTRTWHRLACAVEDAGFEVRDSIAWLYGSGFPKSLDVSKAIDKAAGATREVTATERVRDIRNGHGRSQGEGIHAGARNGPVYMDRDITAPATPDAERWQGWGTALKPAFEPVVVARKPLQGTVAANVLAHGTGALNIAATRVTSGDNLVRPAIVRHDNDVLGKGLGAGVQDNPAGRWPANVVLDESQAQALDEQSGVRTSGLFKPEHADNGKGAGTYGAMSGRDRETATYGDSGGASRFFYVAKAPKRERPTYYRPTCECEDSWPTPTPSHPRATDATTEPGSSSTSKSGSGTTGAQSPRATRSTTSTATSSTTTQTTSSPSPRPITSASTQAASSGTDTGGSHAGSAESSSLSALPTGTSAAKDGRSTDGAARATSHEWSETSSCGECGAPARRESHATVKPLDLMRWLVRLVTPPGGLVLDPFAGSGTTVEACIVEGFRCLAIEREPDYLPLILQRIHRQRDPLEHTRTTGGDLALFELDGESA